MIELQVLWICQICLPNLVSWFCLSQVPSDFVFTYYRLDPLIVNINANPDQPSPSSYTMASRVTLPFWPSSLDCLSWSSDNIIAVGGGDQIGILTPRLKAPGPNGTLWNSTVFKANGFTAAKVPLLHPLTFDNFSAGEELSLRHVHALEWSPPGLGRFRQCILAVLSSNHILSLWESDGKADVAGNWKRSVIVNHALISHYANIEKAENETDQLYRERKQVSQRVRAFAWSSRIRDDLQNTQVAKSTCEVDSKWNLVTLSTEAGDIVILRINAPYDILFPEQTDWEVEVLHSFNIRDIIPQSKLEELQNGDSESFLNSDRLIADHISWGRWRLESDKTASSTLAFIAKGQLFSAQIEAEFDAASSLTKIVRQIGVKNLNLSQSDLTGPLRFVPKTKFLICFAPDTVYCIDGLASKSESGVDVTSHHLDDRWDEVSGVAFSHHGQQAPKMEIVSHLTSSTAATTTLSPPLDDSEVWVARVWQAKINESKDAFSKQHDLAGHVQERTWGIAASPLGEYVATAITLLPSDSIAHIIPSDCRTVVNVTQEVPFNDEDVPSINALDGNGDHITSEVLLFSLQKYVEQRSEAIDFDSLVQLVLQKVNSSATTNGVEGHSSHPSDSDPYQTIARLRSRVLDEHDLVTERFKLLASIALGQRSGIRPTSSQTIQRLVHEVTNLSNTLQQDGELSAKIRKTYKVLNSKLRPLLPSEDTPMEEDDGTETCCICQGPISFESVKWARCNGGHQFSRCALTFLAIQEPGISKRCGVCGAQYLNEWKMAGLGRSVDAGVEMADTAVETGDARADEAQNSVEDEWVQVSHTKRSSIEPTTSLARLLFAAFDTCIYCSGKFIS